MPNPESKRIQRPFGKQRCGAGYGAAGVSYLISVERKMCLTEISFYIYSKHQQEPLETRCFTLWYKSNSDTTWTLLQETQATLHAQQDVQDGQHHLISGLNMRLPRGTHDFCIIAGTVHRPLVKGGPLLSAVEDGEDEAWAATVAPFRFLNCRRIRQNGELFNEASRSLAFRGTLTYFEIELSLKDFFQPSNLLLDEHTPNIPAVQENGLPRIKMDSLPSDRHWIECPVDYNCLGGSLNNAINGCCMSPVIETPLLTPMSLSSEMPDVDCLTHMRAARQINGYLLNPRMDRYDQSSSSSGLASGTLNIFNGCYPSRALVAPSTPCMSPKSQHIIHLGEPCLKAKTILPQSKMRKYDFVALGDPIAACRQRVHVRTPPETPRYELLAAFTPRESSDEVRLPRTKMVL